MSPVAWSYSSITLFHQCPKKYHHLRILKDIKEPKTEHLLYGEQLHKAAEEYIGNNIPLPEQFEFIEPFLAKLKAIKGQHLCEYKMGLTHTGTPCDFFAQDVWWRGIADLLIINEEDGKATIVDYKTGRNAKYADTKQLDFLAMAVFSHFPAVQKIKSALMFVVSEDFVKKDYDRSEYLGLLRDALYLYTPLENAITQDVWNPKPNFTCKGYCAVHSCIHNGKHE
jgi:ATP-dependent exoDNAse (exonuclease V) beta subunit